MVSKSAKKKKVKKSKQSQDESSSGEEVEEGTEVEGTEVQNDTHASSDSIKSQAKDKKEDSIASQTDTNADKTNEESLKGGHTAGKGKTRSKVPVSVVICPYCKIPAEYCEFKEEWSNCRSWMEKNAPEVLKKILVDQEKDSVKGKEVDKLKVKKEKTDREKKMISISITRRKQKKSVTHIIGLEAYGVNAKKAAQFFSKKFACGSTDKKDIDSVEIQGDVRDVLAEVLKEEYNIPSNLLIMVPEKKKKKKTLNPNDLAMEEDFDSEDDEDDDEDEDEDGSDVHPSSKQHPKQQQNHQHHNHQQQQQKPPPQQQFLGKVKKNSIEGGNMKATNLSNNESVSIKESRENKDKNTVRTKTNTPLSSSKLSTSSSSTSRLGKNNSSTQTTPTTSRSDSGDKTPSNHTGDKNPIKSSLKTPPSSSATNKDVDEISRSIKRVTISAEVTVVGDENTRKQKKKDGDINKVQSNTSKSPVVVKKT